MEEKMGNEGKNTRCWETGERRKTVRGTLKLDEQIESLVSESG